jgi:hypothetical protein
MQGTVKPPRDVVPELNIPESLSRVILKAIDKSREQRFQTAEEFVVALNQVANEQVPNEAALDDQRLNDPTPNIGATSLFRSSQTSPIPSETGPSVAGDVMTPPLPAAVPTAAGPLSAGGVSSAPAADSVLVKSAAQHLFLQPRTSGLKHLLIVMVLGLAAVLVVGFGYLKYQSLRRIGIERAVTEKLDTAPSPTLRQSTVRVFVSDTREVTLDGNVSSADDFRSAEALAASVPGVTHVTNRISVISALIPAVIPSKVPGGVPGESAESLIRKGAAFLDDGDYPAAIECFRKAAADSNNNGAQALLERAQRAQKTEEELLRKRR